MAIKRGTKAANVLSGTNAADSMFGFGGNDVLNGKGGNDLLNGGSGADRMSGGTGNDTYIVDNAGDRAIEGLNQGTDTVRSSVDFTLGSNVEILTLLGAAVTGIGNGLDNVVTGNQFNNILRGLTGNDVLIGGLGSDNLDGGDGNDTLLPGSNTDLDVVDGGDGFDTVDYRDSQIGVDVFIGGTMARGAANDLLFSVESVVGSRFDDVLKASTIVHSNAFGAEGNDTILGSDANYDRLRGDDGYDELQGRSDSNEDFVLQYNRGMDRVENYRDGLDQDHIFISKIEFGLSTASLNFLDPAEFGTTIVAGFPSFSGLQRLVWDEAHKILWADPDGNLGSQFSPIPIAYFAGFFDSPSAGDIFVF